MAQALINMEKDIHTKALSDVYYVRDTQQGYVQFLIKWREEFLENRVIHFMRDNWYSCVAIARFQIMQVMKASKDITLNYHGNTKVVKALKRDNGKYSVHLLTYTQKGRLRTDLCIYLNGEEYNKLEDCIGDIYQWIQDIDIGVPTHKKICKMYAVPNKTLCFMQ